MNLYNVYLVCFLKQKRPDKLLRISDAEKGRATEIWPSDHFHG